MFHFFRKSKKEKLKRAVKAENIKRESDIIQKVENYRFTPCGFDYSNMLKRRFKRV
ncbi:MAG: hypothetical protein ACFE94_11770 [Candidatus Hodarchaeota archaeon]